MTRTISVSESGRLYDCEAQRQRFPYGTPFWERVDQRGPDECWRWLGGREAAGYGNLRVGGRATRAHRHAYELTHGPIPDGLVVRHRCDNPPCCNPAHLELGTHGDNARDAVERGRIRPVRGIRHPRGKFTDEQIALVHLLHAEGRSNLDIAAEVGMSSSYVCHVLKGRARR